MQAAYWSLHCENRLSSLFRGSEGNLCYPENRAKKRLLCWLKACCSFACSLAACFAYHLVTTRRESRFPLLPLPARATYSSVITTKNGHFQFFFNSSQRVKRRRFIPFSIYSVLIRENYNIEELRFQGRQSIS